MSVVKGESDLTGEIGKDPIVLLSKGDRARRARDHDDAQEFTGVTDRRDAKGPRGAFGGERSDSRASAR